MWGWWGEKGRKENEWVEWVFINDIDKFWFLSLVKICMSFFFYVNLMLFICFLNIVLIIFVFKCYYIFWKIKRRNGDFLYYKVDKNSDNV